MMVENRLVGALCEVEATGFDLTRTRPARALARWNWTMSLVTVPTPSIPWVPPSTLLGWHVGVLRSWDIPCDELAALGNGRIEWIWSGPRKDFSSLVSSPVERVLFLAQTFDGVAFGFFANGPLSGPVGRDPALKSVIFVLEHPTGEQRKWQLQNPLYGVTMGEEYLLFATGLWIESCGLLLGGCAPQFGMTEVDASFITMMPPGQGGFSSARMSRWEVWSL
jgi:hypothetical protein